MSADALLGALRLVAAGERYIPADMMVSRGVPQSGRSTPSSVEMARTYQLRVRALNTVGAGALKRRGATPASDKKEKDGARSEGRFRRNTSVLGARGQNFVHGLLPKGTTLPKASAISSRSKGTRHTFHVSASSSSNAPARAFFSLRWRVCAFVASALRFFARWRSTP